MVDSATAAQVASANANADGKGGEMSSLDITVETEPRPELLEGECSIHISPRYFDQTMELGFYGQWWAYQLLQWVTKAAVMIFQRQRSGLTQDIIIGPNQRTAHHSGCQCKSTMRQLGDVARRKRIQNRLYELGLPGICRYDNRYIWWKDKEAA